MIKFLKLQKNIRWTALSAFVVGALVSASIPAAAEYVPTEDGGLMRERIGSKPLPFGVKLSISHSYKSPGHASLNFKSSNVESSCASISDYDVELKDSIGILEIEFSDWAIQTYKMLDENKHDICGKHSYAEYRLPLDLETMIDDGVKQLRIWNRTMSDAFTISRDEDGVYTIDPVTKGTYFKIDNFENLLTYEQRPKEVFRVFPDYAPYNEDLMLRKVRAIAHERGYKLLDYTVHYDDRKRPYYIMLDNEEMSVVKRLENERFFDFATIDIDENGRVVPLRINIGRL